MRIRPRTQRRISAAVAVTLGLAAAGGVALALAHRTLTPNAAVHAEQPVAVEVNRIAPAPLLIIPAIDYSGSTEKTDPDGVRIKASRELVNAIVSARPAPAVTYLAPIAFGSNAISGQMSTLHSDSRVALAHVGTLGDTNFRDALLTALPAINRFHELTAGSAGRAVIVISTDGAPSMPGLAGKQLWPGIVDAVNQVRRSGAEVYLIGVADDSPEWSTAASKWRSVLGSEHVLLAKNATSLEGAFRSFAETAFEVGIIPGKQVQPGKSVSISAGLYSGALAAQVTAIEPDSDFRVAFGSVATSTPMRLARRGDQASLRYAASRGSRLTVANTGSSAILVALSDQTAVLRPSGLTTPPIGSPISGIVLDLTDGRGKPLVADASDPVAVSAALSMSAKNGSAITVPLQLRQLRRGRYEAFAADTHSWPSSACRLTVLTRSINGAIGRGDYSIKPSATAWAAVTKPSDLFAQCEAASVPFSVSLAGPIGPRDQQLMVASQLYGLTGRMLAPAWLTPRAGKFVGTLPGSVKDGVLRLSVVGPDGRVISTRQIAYRMRPTSLQALVSSILRFAEYAALIIGVLGAAVLLWLFLRPPLAGSLLVRGDATPQLFTISGQRFVFARLREASGGRLILLSHGRDAIRVLELGMLPRTTLIRRGHIVPWLGRSLQLI